MSRPILHSTVAAAWLGALAMWPVQTPADGLPDLGDSADASISEPQERTIGKRIMREIRADRTYISDPLLNDYITNLGNRLVAASQGAVNDNRRDFEFFLLNDDTLNAFALLGGFIGTHSALVLATQSESELAGVLGHEIAHVSQRHSSRGAEGQRKAAPLQILGLLAAVAAARSNSPSAGQATEAALATSAALQYQNQLDYSREFEREADRLGILIMTRAGFDANGMVGFFERLHRATRHVDGKAPGYLRTHPLTTERIADMQNRVDQMSADKRTAPAESPNFRFAQAALRVASMGPKESAQHFRTEIAARTVLRNRADTYGLALALARANDFAAAEKELAPLRAGAASEWIDTLSCEIATGRRDWPAAQACYKSALARFPNSRALAYGQIRALYEAGDTEGALAIASERIKRSPEDPQLHELAARGYEKKNRRLAQHRALAEAYFRRDNLIGAVDQMEMAVKAKDGDFYEISSAESRLRELKLAFRTRPLMPGEKRDTPRDKEEEEEERNPRPQGRR
ncbi:MAG: M48 family metallopeptidase [Betaproteobacteria bacterium]|nr:M48 family metallopeptidase [Betaproteobacteria bacterium]